VIWLTWRQFRASAVTAVVGLAGIAILLALTPQASELSRCVGQAGCPLVAHTFLGMSHDHLLKYLSTALVAVPAILGAFWGAPLVARELEAGTYRLAWTQSVTRRRWFVTKVAMVGLAAAVACGLFSLMLGEWSSAVVTRGRLSPAMFAERGIVPVGYALFALAVGLTAGVLIRRTVPAMAATLVVFLAVRMGVQFWVRPHLVPVEHASAKVGGMLGITQTSAGVSLAGPAPNIPGAWVISDRLVDAAGHTPSAAFVHSICGSLGGPAGAGGSGHPTEAAGPGHHELQGCVTRVAARFHEAITYQPASHYWALQGAETALFAVAALLLAGFSFWWIRRRLT
jgi:hypothetical protein